MEKFKEHIEKLKIIAQMQMIVWAYNQKLKKYKERIKKNGNI